MPETADTAKGIPKDRSWLPLLGKGVCQVLRGRNLSQSTSHVTRTGHLPGARLLLNEMALTIWFLKGNKLYYYVVESARVDGKPRIVQQTYLGTADRLADLLKESTAPVPCRPQPASSDFPEHCG